MMQDSMKMKRKTTDAEKVKAYEEALNDIAAWSEPKLSQCDEPGAAANAREVLGKMGATKYIKKLVIKSSHHRVRVRVADTEMGFDIGKAKKERTRLLKDGLRALEGKAT